MGLFPRFYVVAEHWLAPLPSSSPDPPPQVSGLCLQPTMASSAAKPDRVPEAAVVLFSSLPGDRGGEAKRLGHL